MAKESTSRVAGIMERKSATNRKGAIRGVVKLVIIIAILAVLFLFRGQIKQGDNRYIRPIFNKGEQRIEQINRQNIERDHQRRQERENMIEKLSEQ